MFLEVPKNLSKISVLKDRAHMLAQVRAFFSDKNVLEVDCPLATTFASIDTHIDLLPALYNNQTTRYLTSSPEYGMKRLLAQGMGHIYQLAHVFRDGECGNKHNPEFMMIEWYRLDFTLQQMSQETCNLIQLFIGPLPMQVISYREAFQKFLNVDYVHTTEKQLLELIQEKKIETYPGIEEDGKDALLNLLLATCIEPQLGEKALCILQHYPASQCALATKKQIEDEFVAERFEIYYQGLELANGYHELTDAKEQRKRFVISNSERLKNGKKELPIDEYFLSALEKGLPNCSGVAVGFDRLMMIRHQTPFIEDVIPFSWEKA
ncbi:MAG: EF-P lysine aminoacylase GenX [Chlamydia sp. 32-24]|nr:MAG: EF-P lysine aminoacylase GenX [Chlamydia sp. 32-24]